MTVRERLFAALLVVVSAGAVFLPILAHDFVNLDDHIYILENPHLLAGFDLETLRRYFSEAYHHNWIPLTSLSLHVDFLLHGREAAGYLVTNVVLHTLGALLLLAALLRLTGTLNASAFTALLFAVHPLHVESVAWVSERKDVLSGVLFMLTLLAYAGYAKGPPRLARMLPVAAVLGLGLLAKPMLVTVPFVLLLLDFWPLARMRDEAGERPLDPARLGPLVLEKLPLFAIVIAISFVTFVVQQATGAVASLERVPIDVRIANALGSYVVYLEQTILPRGLAVLYPYPDRPDWLLAGGGALVLFFGTLLAARFASQRPYLIVGWLWFVGMLVPVIGLVQVGLQAHADRYMYLPQIGLGIVLAWSAADAIARRPALRPVAAIAGVLAIVVFGGLARQQTAHWRDTRALYSRALDVTAGNYLAHKGLADALMKEGRASEALRHFEQASALHPDWSEAELGAADALASQGDLDRAIAIYERWIDAAPQDARPVGSLGLALLRVGRLEAALDRIEAGLRLDPRASELHAGHGVALLGLGRAKPARAAFREALRLDPGDPNAANNLAWLLATSPDPALRDPEQAIRIAETAAVRAPEDPALLDTLATAYAAAGRFADAVATSERAAAIAEQHGATALVGEIRSRTALYRKGRAYLEGR